MDLAIDIGNSSAKLALFDESGELVHLFPRDPELTAEEAEEIVKEFGVKKAILSSTGTPQPELLGYLEKAVYFIHLSHETPVPFINRYDTPETLGKDRIALVAGASGLLPDTNLLVIDTGTCMTFDFIDKDKNYLGGAISPGLWMRFQAMHELTARLPLVEKQRLDSFIGSSTESCMRSGAQWGLIYEIQGFIDAYTQRYEQTQIFMTGGDAAYLVSLLKKEIFVHPNLVPIGLNKILHYNAY